MSFEKRREYLFIYTVKDANPNGDPLDANRPRYDEETGHIMVSDVRIKRTIRDQFMRDGQHVFVDAEPKSLSERSLELAKIFGLEKEKIAEVPSKCIDTKLFGVVFSPKGKDKGAFSWTGPVQFKWGRSLNAAEIKLIQGTAGFASDDGKGQRSFRNEYIVPFVAIASYAIANQHPSKQTGATDADLDTMREALWTGTTNLITRSKVGHIPRLLLEITYTAGFNGAIGGLDEKINLKKTDGSPLTIDEQRTLRSLGATPLDLAQIVHAIKKQCENIEKVTLILDDNGETRILGGLDALKTLLGDKLHVEMR